MNNGETMSVLITRKHQVGNSNMFRINFTESLTPPAGTIINLNSASVYNSFRNIHSRFGNNTFSISFLGTTYNITMENQGMNIDDIGEYIKSECFNRKLYWIQSNEIQYPFELLSNPTSYGSQFIALYIPSATDVSGSSNSIRKPDGATWNFPSSRVTAQLVMASPLAKMLGFVSESGVVQTSFPPSSLNTNYTVNSSSAPDMKMSYENILVKCNWLNNVLLGQDGDILANITINASYGDLISFESKYNRGLTVVTRPYQNLTLALYDSEDNPLDSSVLFDRDVTFIVDLTFPKK